jgi:hypothetical protein
LNSGVDIPLLRRAAEAALQTSPRGIVSGWPISRSPGQAYTGAAFSFASERWVVVRGPQKPDSARLLDATAALRHAEGADYGLAILDPDAKPNAKRSHAPDLFRTRFQSAVWHGLGIVWVEAAGPGAWNWEPDEPPDRSDLDRIAEAVERELIERADAELRDWLDVLDREDSPAAEPLVRQAVGAVLASHGFKEAERKSRAFLAFWRGGKADGLWRRAGEATQALALEVKVSEDAEAPLCQALDDLGQFDAVLYVRLVNEATRREIVRRKGMQEAQRTVQEQLPVRYIEVRFCALCRHPTENAGLSYPHLVCHRCGDRATTRDGAAPDHDSLNDNGTNPVWIDGKKCWRRYRFGGFVTMLDPNDCSDLETFYAKHGHGS